MDFSKLNSNEKLAAYGAIASIVGPILAAFGLGFGVGWLTLILALAMLAIIFLPQFSPQTQLPGSKGTLMLIVGGIAAVSSLLALLSFLSFLAVFGANVVFMLGLLIGIIGGFLMGWAGWQQFQAEGGVFRLGSGTASGPPSSTDAPPPAPGATPPPASTQPPASTPPPAAPTSAAPTGTTPPPPTSSDTGTGTADTSGAMPPRNNDMEDRT